MRADLDARELATVLAALRWWQLLMEHMSARGEHYDIATNQGKLIPLADDEIDDLCQRLNRK